MTNYAELLLYLGFCPADGAGEFKVNSRLLETKPKVYWMLYNRSMERVNRYLSPDWQRSLQFGTANFVDDEDQAKQYIGLAEEHFPEAEGVIIVKSAAHGLLKFRRTIRFEGYTEEQRDELTDRLLEVGIELKPTEHMLKVTRDEESAIQRVWDEGLSFH